MTDRRREDVPKIMATIMLAVPGLTIRTGWAYLQMRRDIRRSSRIMMKEMVDGGLPEEYAKKLTDDYSEALSVRSLVRNLGGMTGFMK